MANIASVLKEEISRLARKEVRSETEKLKKSSAQHRSELAALKRRVATLEQQVSRLDKSAIRKTALPSAPDAAGRVRLSAKGLSAQRQRLGLSAADMATLVGVSGQTIYNWETGSSRPREPQIAAIAAVRGLSKKEAAARLVQNTSAN